MRLSVLYSTVVLAVALTTAPAQAANSQSPADPPTPVTGVSVPHQKPVKVICRTMHAMGTRLGGKRICLTKDQWDDRRLQDRQALEKMQASTRAPRG